MTGIMLLALLAGADSSQELSLTQLRHDGGLTGRWRIVRFELGGDCDVYAKSQGALWVFDNERLVFARDGNWVEYSTRSNRHPWQIDLRAGEYEIYGIYRLQGHQLQVSLNGSGFFARPGSMALGT